MHGHLSALGHVWRGCVCTVCVYAWVCIHGCGVCLYTGMRKVQVCVEAYVGVELTCSHQKKKKKVNT